MHVMHDLVIIMVRYIFSKHILFCRLKFFTMYRGEGILELITSVIQLLLLMVHFLVVKDPLLV